MQNALKREQAVYCSQFQITSDLLRNLNKFNLTPVTKLVLLELTTHLNENKNGSVVFPSVGYIAEVLGIGLTAAKKAINDLIKEGLIIKSKRDKIKGNYNKYLLTPKVRNLTSEPSENEFFKKSECDLFMITNKHEHNKQQTCKGGNVYLASEQSARAERSHVYRERSQDDEILADYALKHNAKNIKAYISKLKETGSANKIICEYKKKNYSIQRIKETQLQIQKYKKEAKFSVAPPESWHALGKKFGYKK